MSVLQKLLHRKGATTPSVPDAGVVAGTADGPPAVHSPAEVDLQGYMEMPSAASLQTEAGVGWTPECGTPCFSKAHHHDHK